jgi:hypothetical protein
VDISTPLEKEISPLEEMMLRLARTDITTFLRRSGEKLQFFAKIPKGRARPPSRLACTAILQAKSVSLNCLYE